MSVSGFGPMLWGWFCGVIGVVFALSALIFFMYLRKRGQTIRDDMSTFVSQEKFEAKYGPALANERRRLFEQKNSVNNEVEVYAQSAESNQAYQIVEDKAKEYFRKASEALLKFWMAARDEVNACKLDPNRGINDGYSYGAEPIQPFWPLSENLLDDAKDYESEEQNKRPRSFCYMIRLQFEVFRKCNYPDAVQPVKKLLQEFIDNWLTWELSFPRNNILRGILLDHKAYFCNYKLMELFAGRLALGDTQSIEQAAKIDALGAVLEAFNPDVRDGNMGVESILHHRPRYGFEEEKLQPCFRKYLAKTELYEKLLVLAAVTVELRRFMNRRLNPFRDEYSANMSKLRAFFDLGGYDCSMEQTFQAVSSIQNTVSTRSEIDELIFNLGLCDVYANAPSIREASLTSKTFNAMLNYFDDKPKERCTILCNKAKQFSISENFIVNNQGHFEEMHSLFNDDGLHSNFELALMELRHDCSKKMVTNCDQNWDPAEQLKRLDVIVKKDEAFLKSLNEQKKECSDNINNIMTAFKKAKRVLDYELTNNASFSELSESSDENDGPSLLGAIPRPDQTTCMPCRNEPFMRLMGITNRDWANVKRLISQQPMQLDPFQKNPAVS